MDEVLATHNSLSLMSLISPVSHIFTQKKTSVSLIQACGLPPACKVSLPTLT